MTASLQQLMEQLPKAQDALAALKRPTLPMLRLLQPKSGKYN